jgi:tRNA 2-thiouridine synthesizing protein A
VAAGFVDFAITWRGDVFSGAPQQSSAADFGTLGINFRARKLLNDTEWADALAELACEVSPVDQPSPLLGGDAFFDAGDTGCADGPLDEIARLIRKLDPGQTLEVRATDASVVVDLPAWCRLTGHALVAQQDDHYLIRRR